MKNDTTYKQTDTDKQLILTVLKVTNNIRHIQHIQNNTSNNQIHIQNMQTQSNTHKPNNDDIKQQ